jgi:hypothetical protein
MQKLEMYSYTWDVDVDNYEACEALAMNMKAMR